MATLNTLLQVLYDRSTAKALADQISRRIDAATVPAGRASEGWSPSDMVLIAYADSIQGEGQPPLQHLRQFVSERLSGMFSQVHILPFFP